MKTPTMLYRCPGPETFEGVACETTIVDESEVQDKLAEGWHMNWIEAGAAVEGAADKIAANEQEQGEIARKLAEAGETAPKLTAVHKGRGVWAVVDAAGVEVQTGLTKEAAQEAAGG